MKLKTLSETWLKKYEGSRIKNLNLIVHTSDFIVPNHQNSFILETAPVYGTLHTLIHQ
jgi:hypothetical protein